MPPPTGHVGRAADVAEVLTLLGDPTVTIVPVVAPAEVGKPPSPPP
ncbi:MULTISPECIES: hypothetical protein [Rhodococcus]|nr:MULTISPECIES: hypothetical protein [Rhodococcus]QQZ17295.1 hypothetical protein GO592_15010 [Rhodococcus sp. 21391]